MIVHSYEYFRGGPGLGDFIRGSLALHQISIHENIDLHISFNNHPISKFLIANTNHSALSEDVINIIGHYSIKETTSKLNDLGMHQKNIAVISNAVPKDPISKLTKTFVKNALIPTDELMHNVERNKPTSNYEVVHVRLGDVLSYGIHYNHSVTYDIDKILDKICTRIWEIKKSTQNIILMCDSNEFKEIIAKRCNIQNVGSPSIHINSSVNNDQSILNTLTDFFIMTKANKIYQFSVHTWGSGFSSAANWVYDVPIKMFYLL